MAYKSSYTGSTIDSTISKIRDDIILSVTDVADISSPIVGAKFYTNADGVVYVSDAFTLDAGGTYIFDGFLDFGNQDGSSNPQTSILYVESTNLINSFGGGWFGAPEDSASNVQSTGVSDGKNLAGTTPTASTISTIFSATSRDTRDSVNLRGVFNVDDGGDATVQFLTNVGASDNYWVGAGWFRFVKVEASELYTLPTPA